MLIYNAKLITGLQVALSIRLHGLKCQTGICYVTTLCAPNVDVWFYISVFALTYIFRVHIVQLAETRISMDSYCGVMSLKPCPIAYICRVYSLLIPDYNR